MATRLCDVLAGHIRGRLSDLHAIGARALPIMEHHSVRLDESPDLRRSHSEDLVKDRHQDTEGVVTQNRGLGDARKMAILGRRDGEPLGVIDVQHDVYVRAPISDIDDAIGRDGEPLAQLLYHRDLAIACRHTDNPPYLAGFRIEIKL